MSRLGVQRASKPYWARASGSHCWSKVRTVSRSIWSYQGRLGSKDCDVTAFSSNPVLSVSFWSYRLTYDHPQVCSD